MADMINHPSHYNYGSVEAIEYIDALDLTYDFARGNAIKYMARSDHKGRRLEDLKKARFYVQYLIDHPETLKNGKNLPSGRLSPVAVAIDWMLPKGLTAALYGVSVGTLHGLITAKKYLDQQIAEGKE